MFNDKGLSPLPIACFGVPCLTLSMNCYTYIEKRLHPEILCTRHYPSLVMFTVYTVVLRVSFCSCLVYVSQTVFLVAGLSSAARAVERKITRKHIARRASRFTN